VICLLLGGAALYAARGFFAALVTFLMTFISCLVTFNYYTLVEKLLLLVSEDTASYADGAALLLTFSICFFILQYVAVSRLEESVKLNSVINGIGGAFFGGLASLLVAGVLVIAWFMLPASIYFRTSDEPPVVMQVDQKLLQTVRFIANDRLKGERPFDPDHNFMRTDTNKFRSLQSGAGISRSRTRPEAEEPAERGERPGQSGTPRFDRTRIPED